MKRKTGQKECAVFETSCVAFNLRKSSQAVSRFYAQEMQGSPVKGPLFGLLATIHKRGPATITAIAREIGLDRTTLTRNLKPLEQRGMIHIARVTANRKEIRILPAGEAALRSALLCWRKAQKKVIDALGERRWDRMRKDLAAVTALSRRD